MYQANNFNYTKDHMRTKIDRAFISNFYRTWISQSALVFSDPQTNLKFTRGPQDTGQGWRGDVSVTNLPYRNST